MSFILKDGKLFIDLVNSLVKNAQVPQTSQDKSIIETAKKLTNKLEGEYSDVPAPLNISSATDADLNVADLQNIGKFLLFLTSRQIKLDGERIAYSKTEPEFETEVKKSGMGLIAANVSRDPLTRGFEAGDFLVNIPLITKYISYLQEKALSMEKSGDEQGKVLRVMIGKLIDSVNKYHQTGLLRAKPKSAPENPNALADDTVIDGFNEKLLDIKNPLGDIGSQVTLKGKDLKTKESLMSWLMHEGTGAAKVAVYDGGQRTIKAFIEEGVSQCLSVGSLAKRATLLLNTRAESAQQKKIYTYYVNKMRDLLPQFVDPDGKACSVGVSADAGAGTDAAGRGQGAGTGKPGSGDQKITLEQLMTILPFDLADINFAKIRRFFNGMKQLTVEPQTLALMNAVENDMTKFTNTYMQFGTTTISLAMNVKQFASMLKTDKTANEQIFGALELLHQILDRTYPVVQWLWLNPGIRGILTNPQQALILGQIGRSTNDSSIYRDNSDRLDAMSNQVNTAARPVRRA
jgi:hypothetical protein